MTAIFTPIRMIEDQLAALVARNGIFAGDPGRSGRTDPVGGDAKERGAVAHAGAGGGRFAIGRRGTCGELALEKAGISHDERERLSVNENYQTDVPHICAAGDVIGFPALAATSMDQGRIAACHAFGVSVQQSAELLPYGIYAVPEISFLGKTEEQANDEGIPAVTGIARYEELSRGQLLGDFDGTLKLIVGRDDRSILGVHCVGTQATELIHIGQMAMMLGGTIDCFVDNVFNYPTLAEAYKVAALNAVNKLEGRPT